MLKKLLLALVFLVCYYSYSNAYDQQYQVGDTGPNGGEVTNVIVTSTITDQTTAVTGDFIEYTDTYLYEETITESIQNTQQQTTYVSQEIQSSNLLTTEIQNSAAMINTFDCSNTNNCYGMGATVEITTGNETQGGGSAIVDFDLSTYNDMTEIDYGGKVYSHSSNATVPNCNQTNGDCKDEFKVTLTLKNGNTVLNTYTHNYTNMNWSGVRDYAFNQDVSQYSNEIDSASLEFYGIDRGYNTGYYGPGFSDAFLQVTYSELVAQINNIINYTVMTTIKQTEESVIDSVYSPQPIVENFNFEPITEPDAIELSFDTSTNETMTFEIEVVEVENVVEVNMTTDYGGELDVETIEVIDVVEVLDMPDISMEMEMPNIDMQMAELEIEMPEIEINSTETVEVTVNEDTNTTETAPEVEVQEPDSNVEQRVDGDGQVDDSTETEPEVQSEPEPEREVEPETESEPESSDREVDNGNDSEDREDSNREVEEKEEKEETKKEQSKEEKIKTAIAKAKQKVAQKILAKIVSVNDTIALDNTTLALMIALSDQEGFNVYQQMSLQDIQFYEDNGLLDTLLPTNNMNQYFLFGGSDVAMDNLVNLQFDN